MCTMCHGSEHRDRDDDERGSDERRLASSHVAQEADRDSAKEVKDSGDERNLCYMHKLEYLPRYPFICDSRADDVELGRMSVDGKRRSWSP